MVQVLLGMVNHGVAGFWVVGWSLYLGCTEILVVGVGELLGGGFLLLHKTSVNRSGLSLALEQYPSSLSIQTTRAWCHHKTKPLQNKVCHSQKAKWCKSFSSISWRYIKPKTSMQQVQIGDSRGGRGYYHFSGGIERKIENLNKEKEERPAKVA